MIFGGEIGGERDILSTKGLMPLPLRQFLGKPFRRESVGFWA